MRPVDLKKMPSFDLEKLCRETPIPAHRHGWRDCVKENVCFILTVLGIVAVSVTLVILTKHATWSPSI